MTPDYSLLAGTSVQGIDLADLLATSTKGSRVYWIKITPSAQLFLEGG
jgi:hypothetical protein